MAEDMDCASHQTRLYVQRTLDKYANIISLNSSNVDVQKRFHQWKGLPHNLFIRLPSFRFVGCKVLWYFIHREGKRRHYSNALCSEESIGGGWAGVKVSVLAQM